MADITRKTQSLQATSENQNQVTVAVNLCKIHQENEEKKNQGALRDALDKNPQLQGSLIKEVR